MTAGSPGRTSTARARSRCAAAHRVDAGDDAPGPTADTDIAIFGDAAVWQNWLDRTPFRAAAVPCTS
ncbi:hypothetical protein I552_7532 [Mycobacterium xenopi 3993]|nr:hypothetical protein I552_7532 [Mycobacterium xenopi 3993]